MPLLEVKDLSKSFTLHHLGGVLGAFTRLSFHIEPGEFLLLSGPNGAGKSTLLRSLYRSYRVDSGEIVFASDAGRIDLARAADVDIAHLRKREIGFVTQFLHARPRVSAEDLVAEPLLQAGHALDDARAQARALLADFGVKSDLWKAYPTTFSGGEQQKVNLARALIFPQRLLLLDEPTASLDVAARSALIARLAQLKAAGTAMIGVFHHPGDVMDLIDRTIELRTKDTADVVE